MAETLNEQAKRIAHEQNISLKEAHRVAHRARRLEQKVQQKIEEKKAEHGAA